MIYIVDLDNTLVNTDNLNNTAYNYALTESGFAIKTMNGRLTRDIVFAEYEIVDPKVRTRIIELKQDYFVKHLDQSILNQRLIDYLLIDNKRFVIWTGADCNRAVELMNFHKISEKCGGAYYLEKVHPLEAINRITMELKCGYQEICVIDDDYKVIKELTKIGINAVSISDFMNAI